MSVIEHVDAGRRAFAHKLRGEVFASPYGQPELQLWLQGWNEARDALYKDTEIADPAKPSAYAQGWAAFNFVRGGFFPCDPPCLENPKSWAEGWLAAMEEARAAAKAALVVEKSAEKEMVTADAIGASVIPNRYAGERECIDLIRDRAQGWLVEALKCGCSMNDAAFAVHCASTAFKYRFRTGKKDVAEQDIAKAEWYEQMFQHLCGNVGDPRQSRPGFEDYVQQIPADAKLFTDKEPK